MLPRTMQVCSKAHTGFWRDSPTSRVSVMYWPALSSEPLLPLAAVLDYPMPGLRRSAASWPFLQVSVNHLQHLRDAQVISHDNDGVVRWLHMPFVAFVPALNFLHDLCQRRKRGVPCPQALAQLYIAAAGAFFQASGQVDFQFRVGQHNRADVTSHHDDAIMLVGQCTLLLSQHHAHFWMVRYLRDDFRDRRAAYLPRHVLATNLHGVLASILDMWVVDHDISVPRQFSQRHSIPRIDAPLQRQPCYRAVHSPGVKIEIAQLARQLLPNRTLPGPRRSINGDSRWPHVSSAGS